MWLNSEKRLYLYICYPFNYNSRVPILILHSLNIFNYRVSEDIDLPSWKEQIELNKVLILASPANHMFIS